MELRRVPLGEINAVWAVRPIPGALEPCEL